MVVMFCSFKSGGVMLDRRSAPRGLSGALVAGGTVVVAGPASAGDPSLKWKSQASYSEDEQLDMILKELDSLPEELKRADPRTYPNYESEIAPYLEGITTVQKPSSAQEGGMARPMFDPIGCPIALASFVIQFGVPVTRIMAWINKARKLWGGARGILRAIRSGDAAAAIGEDAVNVISELLGVPGIIETCFS